MDLLSTKILVALLFGAVRFLFGLLPIKLYRLLMRWEEQPQDGIQSFVNQRRHNQVVCFLALGQSFGGGVLFATCFIHMMPEVYKSVEELKRYGGLNTEYPLSQLTISAGFFLVYFVEEFSHWFLAKIPDKPCKTPPITTTNRVSPTDELPKELVEQEQEAEEEVVEKVVKSRQQVVRSTLIVMALSFHAIFEGLSIGLQSSVSNIWYLFIAVCIHSATILFCIGLELLLAQTRICTIILHVLILSITSPFGVFLGLLITMEANMNTKAKSGAVVLLEGLSAGTILYIIFFEILNREKARRIYRLRRGVCIIGGFALMAMLQWAELYR